MKTLFDYQEILEVVANGFQELAKNATKAQKNIHEDEKKKDYKAMFSIQVALDVVNFDCFLMLRMQKRHGIS